MASSASASSSATSDVTEVLQWMPQWERLRQVASATPTPADESALKLARRFAFRRDCGLWMAFRSARVRAGGSSTFLEVNDLDAIVPPDSSANGGFYWDSGPVAPGNTSSLNDTASRDANARSVSFSVPVNREHRSGTHHRWRVPCADIRSVERHLFSQPINLLFKGNGELCSSQDDISLNSLSRGSGGHARGSPTTLTGATGPNALTMWPFRLWGPCGLIINLEGDVDLFLVCASAQVATVLEASLLRARRAAGRSPSVRPNGVVLSPLRSIASPVSSRKCSAGGPRFSSASERPLSVSSEWCYDPSFASAGRPNALGTFAATGTRTAQSDLADSISGASPTASNAIATPSVTVPVSQLVEVQGTLPALYQNNLPSDGRPPFMVGVSSFSSPSHAPPTGTARESPEGKSSPAGDPQQSSHALTVPAVRAAPATLCALSGTPPSKRTLRVRPLAAGELGAVSSFQKIHLIAGGDTKKVHMQPPFPEQKLYFSKHRTCFLHRAEHRLRSHRTPRCVAIDLLQTTVVNTQPTGLLFVLEYACLNVHAPDWSRLASIREVSHPLSHAESPRVAYVLLMELLAPSLTVKADWIDWMSQRGAVVSRGDHLVKYGVHSDAPPLRLEATPPMPTARPSSPSPPPFLPHGTSTPRLIEMPASKSTALTQKNTVIDISAATAKPPETGKVASPDLTSRRSASLTASTKAQMTPFSPLERDDTQSYRPLSSRMDSVVRQSTNREDGAPSMLLTNRHSDLVLLESITARMRDSTTNSAALDSSHVAIGDPTFASADSPEKQIGQLAASQPKPHMFGRVSPLWVSASYSPNTEQGGTTADQGSRTGTTAGPESRRPQPFHSPLSIKTSANATPFVLRQHVDGQSAPDAGKRNPTLAGHAGADATPKNVAAELSLLADTSPSQTVDVDTSGSDRAEPAPREEVMNDAPLESTACVAPHCRDSPLADDDDAAFVVETAPSDLFGRVSAHARPMQVLPASASLRRAAPVLPLQEFHSQPSATVAVPPARRPLRPPPPPTPPADLTADHNSDFDAVAYRLAHLASEPSSAPRRLSSAERGERAPLIYDSSVLLTSSGSPGTPSAASPPRRARVREDQRAYTTPNGTLQEESGGEKGRSAAAADHFDSPVRASTRSPHSHTPNAIVTPSTASPYSVAKLPSSGSPPPAMRGQILFHSLDTSPPRDRDASASRTLASVSPPTSRHSTADVVTAVSTPLRVQSDSDGGDNAVLYCSPDVMHTASARSTSDGYASPTSMAPLDHPSRPRRPDSLRDVRMAPFPTPTESSGVEHGVDPRPAPPVPVALRPFLDDDYTPPSSHGETSRGHALFQDPHADRTLSASNALQGDHIRLSSAERKKAFRESLYALRQARGSAPP